MGGAVTEQRSSPRAVRRAPVLAWIRGLQRQVFVLIVAALIAALVLLTVVVNPGERVGPVQPARPPVGGPVLPATRL